MKRIATIAQLTNVNVEGCAWGCITDHSAVLIHGRLGNLATISDTGYVVPSCGKIRQVWDGNLNAALAHVCDIHGLSVICPEPPEEGSRVWTVKPSLPLGSSKPFYTWHEGAVSRYPPQRDWEEWRLILVDGVQAVSPYRCERNSAIRYDPYGAVYHYTYKDACLYVAGRYQNEADGLADMAAAWRRKAKEVTP